MSGLEVAGLALAILPVLASCIEQYNTCLGPFSRYRRFAKEARDYCREIEVQRTIFSNACRNLLEEVVDHDAASGMLNALDQQAWANGQLDERLAQLLGESLKACVTTISLIEERLQEISGESERLKCIVENEKKITPKTIRDKVWKRNVGEKLRLSFSKPRLDENIAKLRSYNDDLRVLTRQTRQTIPTSTRLRSNSSRRIRTDIKKYQNIGKASCQVYEALRKACTKHTEHVAHFRMEVEHVICDKESSLQVQFDMAFTHRTLTDTYDMGYPIWFLVDSIINEHTETCINDQAACISSLAGSLKRQLEPTVAPVAKKLKKSVRFTSPALPASSSPCFPRPAASNHVMADSIGRNFCDHLRRHFCQPLPADACVVLENSAQCKQLVYPSNFTATSKSRKGTSLGQLLESKLTSDLGACLLLHERIALAKVLAIAVLQYYATPWLRLSWHNEDILFFAVEEESRTHDRSIFAAPYINARIQGPSAPTLPPPKSNMARNPVLFSLGVLLLELAYGATLKSLTLPCDAENGQLHCEFFTARRLAKSKRTIMGAVYNDVVEQLVEGVFPCSADLNKPESQAAFYEDIICPLDELEQGFRKLCMD